MAQFKILVTHNYYQQPGGEDQIFAAESSMLEKHGCRVFRYTVHNDRIKGMNSLTLATSTLWNKAIARELQKTYPKSKTRCNSLSQHFPHYLSCCILCSKGRRYSSCADLAQLPFALSQMLCFFVMAMSVRTACVNLSLGQVFCMHVIGKASRYECDCWHAIDTSCIAYI